jgi:hypothetical protein
VESLFTASLHLSDFVQTQNEAKILTFYYSVDPGPSETFRGSNFCVVFIITLFYPLSLCHRKGE